MGLTLDQLGIFRFPDVWENFGRECAMRLYTALWGRTCAWNGKHAVCMATWCLNISSLHARGRSKDEVQHGTCGFRHPTANSDSAVLIFRHHYVACHTTCYFMHRFPTTR